MGFFSDFGNMFTNPTGGGIGSENSGGILGFKRKYLDPIGDPLNFFGNAKKGVEDYVSGKQANDVKAAYDQAMGMTQQNMRDLMNFYDTRKQQAQQFYAPMQQMFQNAYGTQGIQGPMVPRATNGPLQSMYGGK